MTERLHRFLVVAAWSLVSAVVSSFLEQFAHRTRTPILHHTKYCRIFDPEPDPLGHCIDLELRTALRLNFAVAPIVLAIGVVSLTGAILPAQRILRTERATVRAV